MVPPRGIRRRSYDAGLAGRRPAIFAGRGRRDVIQFVLPAIVAGGCCPHRRGTTPLLSFGGCSVAALQA
jgi:hypothetical protein